MRRGPGRQVVLYTLRCCRPATHPDPSIKLTYTIIYTKYTESGEKITAWCGVGVVLHVWYHIHGAAAGEDLTSSGRAARAARPTPCSCSSLLEGEDTKLVFCFISFSYGNLASLCFRYKFSSITFKLSQRQLLSNIYICVCVICFSILGFTGDSSPPALTIEHAVDASLVVSFMDCGRRAFHLRPAPPQQQPPSDAFSCRLTH